jgi:hypothetical protein
VVFAQFDDRSKKLLCNGLKCRSEVAHYKLVGGPLGWFRME